MLVLHRLAHDLQDAVAELGQLIQEEHAVGVNHFVREEAAVSTRRRPMLRAPDFSGALLFVSESLIG